MRQINTQDLWGKRLPSQRVLSRKMGVSLETVNLAIGLLKKEGVVHVIPKQGVYGTGRRSEPATGSKRKRTRLLMVSHGGIPSFHEPGYLPAMLGPVVQMVREIRSDLIMVRLDDSTAGTSIVNDYPPHTIDKLVFVATYKYPEQLRFLVQNYKCPKVMLDHHIPGLGVTGIMEDAATGILAATRHIIGLGHRRIAFFDMATAGGSPWKRAGYHQAMQEAGLEADPNLLINTYSMSSTLESRLRKLMQSRISPTAFVCVDDGRAFKVKNILEELGYRVGKDIAVAGYGDTAFQYDKSTEIFTSVRYDASLIGERAVDCLLGRLPGTEGDVVTVPTELVIRESTAGCRLV